jgi:hypothetical protein
MKTIFSKEFMRAPIVAAKFQEKIGFHFKRIFTTIGAKSGSGFLELVNS